MKLKMRVTKKTYACFEPTLDYVVVKIPKWPFDKFKQANRKLGTKNDGNRRNNEYR